MLLLCAVTFTAMGSGMPIGPFSDGWVVAVCGGAVLLLVPTRPQLPSHPWVLAAAALAAYTVLGWQPRGNVTITRWYDPATPLVVAALAVVAALPLLRHPSVAGRLGRWLGPVAATGVALALGGMVFVIAGGVRPRIDVWVIFQQAGHGVWNGLNPYAMRFPGVPAGQTDDCFNYLPTTFLTAAAGVAVGEESRYAELAVLGAGWVALVAHVWRRTTAAVDGRVRQGALGLVVLAVALPCSLRVAQQAWNESILLGLLLLGVVLVMKERAWWAVVPLALAMATKQHALLLLPAFALWPAFGWRRAFATGLGAGAVVLPWFLAGPSRFLECTVTFFLDLPARDDSLSLYLSVPSGVARVGQLALLAATYLVMARRGVPKASDLLLWCGALTVAFNVFNKQTFQNQWWLSAVLLVLGLALRSLDDDGATAQAEDPVGATVDAGTP